MIRAWAYLMYNIFVGHFYICFGGWEDGLSQKPPLVVPVACFLTPHLEAGTTGDIQVPVANLDMKNPNGLYPKQAHQRHILRLWRPVIKYGQLGESVMDHHALSLFDCFSCCSENISKALALLGDCKKSYIYHTRQMQSSSQRMGWVLKSWLNSPVLTHFQSILFFSFGFQITTGYRQTCILVSKI